MKYQTYRILATLAVLAACASSVIAEGPPPPPESVPDGGSSALLTAIALGGLALGRKLFRK